MRASSFARILFLCSAPLGVSLAFAQAPAPAPAQKPAPKAPAKAAPAADAPIPSPVSRHYPILIVAHGNEPSWSLRLGMKGPERLDRAGYPPIVLDPDEIVPDEPGVSWVYHAKDDVTGADVAVEVSRESCSDGKSDIKYNFKVELQHAQIGILTGCGQSAPEKFPEFRKKNQLDPDDNADDKDKTKDDKDKDKDKDKKSVLDPITNFQLPTAVAYLDANSRVIFSRSAVRRTVAPEGSELAVSHDGRKLLFTRSDSKSGPERTIVLYDWDTGRSINVDTGIVRSAFWSPDDSRIAFLKYDGKLWKVRIIPSLAPEKVASEFDQAVDALHGWISSTTILASDLQNAYWLSDDKPPQTVALKEIYGDSFQVMSSDTIRANPINADLLLVTAYYQKAPTGAPVDSVGLNSTFFLYEVLSKRRTVLGAGDSYQRAAEWSRDGLQIFYTKGVPGK
ncbi:MAG TPA: hypothetical protein VGR58_11860, partial [Candidatus Acidoferrum sp.]|nr:hypothetical protein [Candidatus Acidoferrum sp.]